MLRIVAIMICSGILLLDFGIAGLVNAMSVDEYVEALTPKKLNSGNPHFSDSRGLKGIKSVPQKPQTAMHLLFELNSAKLTRRAKAELQRLGRALQKEALRHYVYRLEGHTCDRGSDMHNMALSQQRAQAVKRYLVRTFDLSANQFQVVWFGETQPLVTNTDEAARRKNRRVVIQNTRRKLNNNSSGKSAALQIKRFRNGIEETVKDGEIIRQDEQYAVEFRAGSDPYIYIFQLDSKGTLISVFPNRKYSGLTNPVTPGTFYRIPDSREDWFSLDENKGTEKIILLSSREPLLDPVATVKTVGRRGLEGIHKRPPATAKANTSAPKSAPAVSSGPEILILKRYFIHQ